ncbi:YcjF family protein [Adlercreutzia faecimuris]|uniref:DUF697 domain-containing protein n=1 Tax=Adlercreutzia faecimuris TaxID=2897341 RepID=A0ABS9WH66_9ACTN|nr:hypothetical protein [Adlercreutzia sp. JBNU-10]MCI2242200.1 hypothetical protein [Adlercreutzia sp. JBNU-10]
MQLPIDIPAVLKAATDIDGAAATPLSVSVYIDETAPGDLAGHVRALLASPGANTRVTIGYLEGERLVEPTGRDDMAVIVAGEGPRVGAQAAAVRAAGTPVMVATLSPSAVRARAEAAGCPIPAGDVAAPDTPAPSASGELPVALADAAREPIALDDAARASLDVRMGHWVIAACAEKKLAFALAFPFVRRPLAVDAVNATALQNAGIGAVVFIPGADMPVMTLNQAKMLLQIAAAYGQPLNGERIKELAAVVGGAFLFRNIARQFAGLVPGLGWAVKAAVGFAGTEAMGRAAIEYFEAGGDIVGLASVVQRARDEAVEAAGRAAATPAGERVIDAAKRGAAGLVRAVRGRARG